MADPTSSQPPRRIRWWEMAAFASPSAPLLALSLPSLIFLGPYFNEHLGLSLSAVSALFLIARFADIVVDPMIGGFQDRTTPAFGRRRFWLVASTPLFMAFIWIVFIGLPPGVPAWVVSLSVLVMYWSYASMTISHLSWAGELQPDYHGRTRTLGAVQIAGMIGYVGMLLLPAIVTQGGFGDSVDAVHVMGYAGLIVLPLTVAWCVLTVKEAPSLPQPHLGFRAAMNALRTNPALRRVLIPDFLIGVGYGVTGALFVFLARDYLGFQTQANTLLLIYFLSGLFGIPIWTWAGRRFGKHNALIAGCIHSGVMLALLPFAPKGDFWVAVAFFVLAGVSQSAGTMLMRSLMADVVDEDTVRTGGKRSGLFFGLLLTTSKVGLAMGPLTYFVLDRFGYDGKLGAANTPEAMSALVWLYAGVPFALNMLAAASLLNYPLNEARIAALRAQIAARDAVTQD